MPAAPGDPDVSPPPADRTPGRGGTSVPRGAAPTAPDTTAPAASDGDVPHDRAPRRRFPRPLALMESERPGEILAARMAWSRQGPLKERAFSSRLHDPAVASRLGVVIAALFAICFVTGVWSYLIQSPLDVGFLSQPTGPAWLYRVTQGLHVIAGIALIPLVLIKLWTIYPLLFEFPPIRSAAHAIERLSIPLLVGGTLLLLASGLANTAQWYWFPFSFRQGHFWTAWIVVGAVVAHVGAKWPIIRDRLRRPVEEPAPACAPRADAVSARADAAAAGLSRRGLLATSAAAVGVVTLTTAGQTIRPLAPLGVLAPRDPRVGPQGLPVNRSAKGALVLEEITAPDFGQTFRLEVVGDVEDELRLRLDELQAFPQHEAELAIACVEGWSASTRWGGVQIREILRAAGAPPNARATCFSLQPSGASRVGVLNPAQAAHPDTLLALRIKGEPLHVDHGFPCRLIGPNRPGVLQTKWVGRIEVRA